MDVAASTADVGAGWLPVVDWRAALAAAAPPAAAAAMAAAAAAAPPAAAAASATAAAAAIVLLLLLLQLKALVGCCLIDQAMHMYSHVTFLSPPVLCNGLAAAA